MKCIEAQQLVKPYLEKQLSDRQLEQFLEHVEHCTECYDELEIYFSIYETLEDSGNGEDDGEYDFKGKLNQDIKNAKRYLRVRKAYRFFRFAVMLLAELLLICTVITGIEMRGEEGSRGTTVYRVIYGQRKAPEPVPENPMGTEKVSEASEAERKSQSGEVSETESEKQDREVSGAERKKQSGEDSGAEAKEQNENQTERQTETGAGKK